MSPARIGATTALLVGLFSTVSCSSGAARSCEELSDQIASGRAAITAEAAWDDVRELRQVVEDVLALEEEFGGRCAPRDE